MSIDAGKPVIARVKQNEKNEGVFRIIIGYDGDTLISPEYTGAQKPPKATPLYDDIEILYIIDDKTQPRYTVRNGLERIIKVMEYNINDQLWDSYTNKLFFYGKESFEQANEEERQRRMKRTADTMWHTFNCHNFSEFFGHLRNIKSVAHTVNDFSRFNGDEYNKLSGEIDFYYASTHNTAWGVIACEENARKHDIKFTSHNTEYLGELAAVAIEKLAENDKRVLSVIKKLYKLYEKE
jgi:hypothetical protein